MKELEQLILSKSSPVQKEAKHIGVSELDKLIMEAVANVNALEEAALGFAQLAKKADRFKNFIQKIIRGEEFELINGERARIKKDPNLLQNLQTVFKSGDLSYLNVQKIFGTKNIRFEMEDGRSLPMGAFKKTGEFGGKGGDFYIKKELSARGELDDLIKAAINAANTDSIIIKLVDKQGDLIAQYDDVVGVAGSEKLRGVDPKSDFQLIRKDNKPPIYISHKDGSSPKHFGQWSGTTKKAGATIHDNVEIQKFVEDLRANYLTPEGTYPKGISYGREIQSPELKRMAIFGQDYSPTGDGSVNNVDIVAQGTFRLDTEDVEKTSDDKEIQVAYILRATHLLAREGFDGDFGPGYTPTIVSRFATARNNFGIRGLRLTIYPKGGRKISKFI
jgi:hypothetical protein